MERSTQQATQLNRDSGEESPFLLDLQLRILETMLEQSNREFSITELSKRLNQTFVHIIMALDELLNAGSVETTDIGLYKLVSEFRQGSEGKFCGNCWRFRSLFFNDIGAICPEIKRIVRSDDPGCRKHSFEIRNEIKQAG